MNEPVTKDSSKSKVEVFSYFDYREFLSDFIEEKRNHRPSFSMRVFSRVCGFGSPNYISLILSGRRNLTNRHILSIVKACQMDRLEGRYFKALVDWNQSRPEDRNHYFDELYRIQMNRSQKVLSQSQTAILGKWYYHVLREMVLLPDFKFEAKWISARLGGRIPPDEIEKAFSLLIQIGLLRKEDEKLVQSDSVITTTNDQKSALIQQFHLDMIPQAAAALRSNEVQDRDFRAITMAISKEAFRKIKRQMKLFEEKVVQIATDDEPPEHIYQLNMQLFHLTKDSKNTNQPDRFLEEDEDPERNDSL